MFVLFCDDVHEAALDVELLDDGLALEGSGHFFVGFRQFQRAGFVDVRRDIDAVLDLAADLDGDLDGLIDTFRFVVSRPGDERQKAFGLGTVRGGFRFPALGFPDLLADVRSERVQQLDEGLELG